MLLYIRKENNLRYTVYEKTKIGDRVWENGIPSRMVAEDKRLDYERQADIKTFASHLLTGVLHTIQNEMKISKEDAVELLEELVEEL